MFKDFIVPEYKEDVNDIMLDAIARDDSNPVIIFGCGRAGKEVFEKLADMNSEVDCFCEGDKYWYENKSFMGRPVISTGALPEYYRKATIIIAATGADVIDIIEKLKQEGEYEFYSFVTRNQLYVMTSEWVSEHVEELNNTYELFSDDLSRLTFLSYIGARANCINRGDTEPLLKLWQSKQYFNDLYPEDLFDEHILIDCGAWIGDTAEMFIEYLSDSKKTIKVRAFEMEEDNYKALMRVAQKHKNITCYHNGVGDKRQVVYFEKNSDASVIVNYKTENSVEIVPIDEVLIGEESKASIVKMDLEGFELNTINGMREMIKANLPMLAICVYHKIDDLITIPTIVRKLYTESPKNAEIGYKYYLRHHSHNAAELVFYAVPYRL